MSALAHIGGLPLEETLVQLGPAALTTVVGLRVAAGRLRWGARGVQRRLRGCPR